MKKAQLVIQTAFLGDLILSIPFLRRVKSLAPHQHLVLVCKKGLGRFLKEAKEIDEFIEIEKSDRDSYVRAREALAIFRFTHLYCVHRSFRSQLFASQIKADQKIGFSSLLGFWIFDECVDYEETWPDAIRKFKLLAQRDFEVQAALQKAELSDLNVANRLGVMAPIPQLFSFGPHRFLKPRRRQICVFPGSVWATKRWTIDGFAETAQEFVRQGYEVLLLGGPDEKDLCDQIATVVPRAKVLAGKLSIAQSIAAVAESELVIANDSAATHMAAFQSTPSVTVFGPTTLQLGFRPWSDDARVVQIDLDCRPCGKHGHQKCPLGHHDCMKHIPADMVLAAAGALIKFD